MPLPRLTDHDEILPYLRAAVLNRARSALRSRKRGPANLSVSANGKVIGLVSFPAAGMRGARNWSDAWVLPVSSPAGPLPKYWHQVIGPSSVSASTEALNPTGDEMIALTLTAGLQTGPVPQRISVYRTRTGKRIRVLQTLNSQFARPAFSLDQHGGYLLMAGWGFVTAQVSAAAFLNLSTDKIIQVPGDAAVRTVGIAG